MNASVEPFSAGFDCYHCGDRVDATYENAIFLVECSECGYHYDYNPTPPGIVHGTDDHGEILDRVAAYNRTMRSGFARRACPLCANHVAHRFVTATDANYPRKDLREAFIQWTCKHCGYIDYLTVGECLLQDSALVSFCLDHSVDVISAPIWELEFAATDACVTVEGTDPWNVLFTLALDEETLEIRLDESLSTTTRVG